MIADIKDRDGLPDKLESIFNVITKTPYTSSNGSEMILYIVDGINFK